MYYLAQYWFVPLILAFLFLGVAVKKQYDNVRTFNFDGMKPVFFLALAAVFNAVLFMVGLVGNLVGVPKPTPPPAPTTPEVKKTVQARLIKTVERHYYSTIWKNDQHRTDEYRS